MNYFSTSVSLAQKFSHVKKERSNHISLVLFLLAKAAAQGKTRRRSNTLPCVVNFRDAFAAARELGLHVRARQSPYPLSDQQRYPVPDFLVDWQVTQLFELNNT